MNDHRTIRMDRLAGGVLPVQCPTWCVEQHQPGHLAEHIWHQGPEIRFEGPGDHYWQDGPYGVLAACVSAEPDDVTGGYGRPYLAFDTLAVGQAARLDVEQADVVIAQLRLYTDRLQQMRDRLAAITASTGANTPSTEANIHTEQSEHAHHQGEQR